MECGSNNGLDGCSNHIKRGSDKDLVWDGTVEEEADPTAMGTNGHNHGLGPRVEARFPR